MFEQLLKVEGDKAVVITHQPTRRLILDTAAELRKAGGVADQQGLGRWALSVPLEDWQRLRGKYPDLASTDAAIKSRAWLAFIASPEAAPFKIRERV